MFDALGIYGGLAAGVLTSLLWTATTLLFTGAGRRIGPTAVNTYRIVLAIMLLAVTHFLLASTWFPQANPRQIWYLALSGIVGLSLGDQALFMSFVYIGPRLAALIMTTSPIMATLFGWLALGEVLRGPAWLGVAITVGGVAWVVLERHDAPPFVNPRHRIRGVTLALLAAAGQSGGYLLSKQGIGHGWLPTDEMMDPLAATFIRMIFAGIGMAPILALRYLRLHKRERTRVSPDRIGSPAGGLFLTACGAFAGSFLGVWMSLEACHRVPLGVAQTLCSLTPLFLLPIVALVYGERVSGRAVIGAIVAVAGSAILFMAPQ